MAKVDRGTQQKEFDPLEGYTLLKEQYAIHALPVYTWDEIADCERVSATEHRIYGPYDTKAEAVSDFDFLLSSGKYTKEQIIIRKNGLYEYAKTVWLPMVLD